MGAWRRTFSQCPLFAAEQAELIGLVLLAALVYRFRLRLMIWGRAIATLVGFRRSGTCVWLGFLFVLLLTMFPPWVQSKTYGGRFPIEHVKLWHAPIFCAPVVATRWESSDVDYARMLTEIAAGECFVLALYRTWARLQELSSSIMAFSSLTALQNAKFEAAPPSGGVMVSTGLLVAERHVGVWTPVIAHKIISAEPQFALAA